MTPGDGALADATLLAVLRRAASPLRHDMAGALRIADSITLLDKGQVVAGGTPRQIVDSSHEMVRRFLDSSGIAAERLVSHS